MSDNEQKPHGITAALAVWAVVIAVFLVGLKFVFKNTEPTSPPISSQATDTGKKEEDRQARIKKDIAAGKVAALINGEPVYFEDLDKGLPPGTYGPRLKKGRKLRFDNLAYIIKMRQFLDKRGITVSEQTVKDQIEDYKKNPPAMACACCRYEDLNEFLELNFMTIENLASMIKVDKGFEMLLEDEWSRELAAIGTKEEYVAAKWGSSSDVYAKASHIFFNSFQDPEYRTDPDKVKERKKIAAQKAWERLVSGEDFEAVAMEVSEDDVSRDSGGFLGYVMAGFICEDFTDALFKLKEDTYSSPVATVYGYHIIKRMGMNDEDKLLVLKNEYQNSRAEDLIAEIDAQTEIKTFFEDREDEDVDFTKTP